MSDDIETTRGGRAIYMSVGDTGPHFGVTAQHNQAANELVSWAQKFIDYDKLNSSDQERYDVFFRNRQTNLNNTKEVLWLKATANEHIKERENEQTRKINKMWNMSIPLKK